MGALIFLREAARDDRGRLYRLQMSRKCSTVSGHPHKSQSGVRERLHQKRWELSGEWPALSCTIAVDRGLGRVDSARTVPGGS